MGQIPLYGVTDDPRFDFLAFARVIFAAQQGTLMELGIGPIVTAGLLMRAVKGLRPNQARLQESGRQVAIHVGDKDSYDNSNSG